MRFHAERRGFPPSKSSHEICLPQKNQRPERSSDKVAPFTPPFLFRGRQNTYVLWVRHLETTFQLVKRPMTIGGPHVIIWSIRVWQAGLPIDVDVKDLHASRLA